MKLASYRYNGSESWGVVIDETILSIPTAAKALYKKSHDANTLTTVLALVQVGIEALDLVQTIVDNSKSAGHEDWFVKLSDVTLLAPLPRPESFRDFMLFEQHLADVLRSVLFGKRADWDRKLKKLTGTSLADQLYKEWHLHPTYYKGNRFGFTGHDTQTFIPKACKKFDFELEFACILTNTGKNIKASKAHEHIFGYTLLNDFSARDIQLAEQKVRLGPAKGKDFDTGTSMGPFLVTKDECDHLNLDLVASVNGKVFGGGNTSKMNWSFDEVIEYVSRDETLYPGEVFGSGTCSGDLGPGCGLESDIYLAEGDVVELSNDVLGLLRNTVAVY